MAALPALSFASMAVHIGEEIERRRVATGMSKTELAKRLVCDRTHIYSIITSPSIDTLVLRECCKALGFNFFTLIAQDVDSELGTVSSSNAASDPGVVYGRRTSNRTPLRLVIEVDPDDKNAQEAALRMGEEMQRRANYPAPHRDKS